MGNINDRKDREHPQGLAQALVYRRGVAVAAQPARPRIQRHERADVAVALRETGVHDTPFLHVRLRAAAQYPRQGRAGAAPRVDTARREVVPRDADHVYLHTQGDEGKDQIRGLQKALRKGAGTVQRLSEDAGVPRVQRGADQPAGGAAGAVGKAGAGGHTAANRGRGTSEFRAGRYDDPGRPLDLPHPAEASGPGVLLHHEERNRRTRKGAVQVRGGVLRNAVPRDDALDRCKGRARPVQTGSFRRT